MSAVLVGVIIASAASIIFSILTIRNLRKTERCLAKIDALRSQRP